MTYLSAEVGREAAVLLEVEKERARRRQQEAASRAGKTSGASRRGERNVPELIPERSGIGDARDKVGAVLNVSGKVVVRPGLPAGTTRELGGEGVAHFEDHPWLLMEGGEGFLAASLAGE